MVSRFIPHCRGGEVINRYQLWQIVAFPKRLIIVCFFFQAASMYIRSKFWLLTSELWFLCDLTHATSKYILFLCVWILCTRIMLAIYSLFDNTRQAILAFCSYSWGHSDLEAVCDPKMCPQAKFGIPAIQNAMWEVFILARPDDTSSRSHTFRALNYG